MLWPMVRHTAISGKVSEGVSLVEQNAAMLRGLVIDDSEMTRHV